MLVRNGPLGHPDQPNAATNRAAGRLRRRPPHPHRPSLQADGFDQLARLERWELSLEALALKPQWGPLFSDEEANEAIHRLLEAGCHFL
ncbi:MAG: hypothetical protein ACLU9S_18825 [Oscillospiraceae bacterium]